MSKKELQTHLEQLKPLLLKRKPEQFDDSPEAAKLKRDIQAWNSTALALLKKTTGAKASAAAFEELGRMKYGSLVEVKEQLRERRKVIEKFLNGGTPKPTPIKAKPPKRKPKVTRTPTKRGQKYEYDVCLSFAGEDRKYAKQLFDALTAAGLNVFYDARRDIAAELWGKDLYVYLDDIYRNRANLCIMFLSKHYAKKLWTNHERESAQSRAFLENREYILPLRLDNTEIPGVRPTTGHREWSVGVKGLTEDVIYKLQTLDPSRKRSVPQLPTVRGKKTATPIKSTADNSQRMKGHIVLLGDKLYAVQELKRHRDGRIDLVVKVPNPQSLAGLRSLESPHYGYRKIRFVDRLDGTDVQVSLGTEETRNKVMTLALSLTPLGGNNSPYRVNISGTSPQEFAQEQLRQLLLGEAPLQSRWYSGMNDLPEDAKKGVLPLAEKSGKGTGVSLQTAELLAVYFIRQKNIVDDIQELKFSRTVAGKVNCSFKGSIKDHSGTLDVVVKGSVTT